MAMGSRDNLRKAAKDLFGTADKSEQDALNYGLGGEDSLVSSYDTSGSSAYSGGLDDPLDSFGGPPDMSEVVVLEPRKSTSVIAEGTTVSGRIRSNGHVEVMGKVDGNIEADGDVTICGRVLGNIRGDQLKLLSCEVKGNLNAEDRVVVNSESVIIGDVNSDSLVLDGKLKGNINANKTAVFNSNSYLLGDITTTTLSIDAGAVINGMVKTYVDFDADSPFDKL